MCGGDGRIDQMSGQTSRCPGCLGSGRRSMESTAFHDVTKTKPSHHRPTNVAGKPEKQVWPTTGEGVRLATQIRDSATLSADTKARLTREIMDYEASHGQCTQTFVKKMRKQIG
jgi:hypothetical protein